MKTIAIVGGYQVLKGAKLTKMEDADKFKVIEAMFPHYSEIVKDRAIAFH